MTDWIVRTIHAGKPLNNVLIIDAHVHFGYFKDAFFEEFDAPAIIAHMDKYGINLACCSHAWGLHENAVAANAEMRRIMKFSPARFRAYCVVNPNFPERSLADAKRCLELPGFIGIKMYPGPGHAYSAHDAYIDHPNYDPFYRLASTKNFCILCHTWGSGSAYSAPARFVRVLEKYPDLKLILAHGGGSYQGLLETFDLIKRYANVYLDITGAECGHIWLEDILKRIDYRRVVFGSDLGMFDAGFYIGRVGLADIAVEQKIAIFGQNMKSLLSSLSRNDFSAAETQNQK